MIVWLPEDTIDHIVYYTYHVNAAKLMVVDAFSSLILTYTYTREDFRRQWLPLSPVEPRKAFAVRMLSERTQVALALSRVSILAPDGCEISGPVLEVV